MSGRQVDAARRVRGLPRVGRATAQWAARLRHGALALLLSAGSWRPAAAGPESLPPGHWAYAELEHFETRGLLVLDSTRPYSRLQVQEWVDELGEVPRDRLTPIEAARLARLTDEFCDGDSLWTERFDPPLFGIADGGWQGLGDVLVGSGALLARGSGDPSTSWGTATIEVTLGHRSGFAYDTRYRAALAEETGLRTGENRISERERTWHGLTSDNDRAYVAFERGRLRLALGRDYLAWGARRGDELLVTETPSSFDALQARLRLGRFLLTSANAVLGSDADRRYAAHRLEIAAGPLRWGLQEAVVYVSQRFEPAYLFPVAFYYGNQFNERGDDNVLLGTDAKWVTRWGLLDGELVVDDFIYDGDPAPQKLAWRLGAARALSLGATDADVRLGYLHINRWTYTHRRGAVAYVAGAGDPTAGDPLLGHALGPDADRWSLDVRWRPHLAASLWLRGTRTRRGEGNRDQSAWQIGSPYDLGFPSGVVTTSWGTEAGGSWQIGRAFEVRAAGGAQQRGSAWDTSLRAEFRIDP